MQMIFTQLMMDSVLENRGFCDGLYNLACRWQDEHLYEDIRDYATPLEGMLGRMFPAKDFRGQVTMTKRPFGIKFNAPFQFTLKDGRKRILPAELQVKVSLSKGEIGWKVTPQAK